LAVHLSAIDPVTTLGMVEFRGKVHLSRRITAKQIPDEPQF